MPQYKSDILQMKMWLWEIWKYSKLNAAFPNLASSMYVGATLRLPKFFDNVHWNFHNANTSAKLQIVESDLKYLTEYSILFLFFT